MYTPKEFEISELEKLQAFIQKHNFATLLSNQQDLVNATHLPLILDSKKEKLGTLKGHMAKANLHWKSMESSELLCVFQGPNAYISPAWYKNSLNVPTWNYAAVHVRGRAKIFQDFEKIEEILKNQVLFEEAKIGGSWNYELPEEFRRKLVNAIVAFEIEILLIEGKFKLSQNRNSEDQEAVLLGVEKQYALTNPGIIELMKSALSLK